MSIRSNIFDFVSGASAPIASAVEDTTSNIIGGISGLPTAAIGALNSGVSGVIAGVENTLGLGGSRGLGGTINNSNSPLKDFLTDIQSRGVAWNNRFYARMTPPPMIKKIIDRGDVGGRSDTDDAFHLMLRTDMAELPGYSFTTSEARNYSPMVKMPNGIFFQDLTLNFIVSADLVERYFFDYWLYLMRDSNNLIEYYDNFVTDISVILYTQSHQPVYGVNFVQCWPVSTVPIQLSWQDMETMRLTVQFSYHRWEPVGFSAPDFSASVQQTLENQNGALRDLFFNILPSIPNGGKVLGLLGMNTTELIKTGVSLVGNSVNTRNPTTRTLIATGTNTFDKFFGNNGGL